MKNKKLKKIIIAGLLIFSWIILTAVYVYSESNLTVITNELNKSVLTKTNFNEFLKGEKITGRFIASEDYLGQVSVRFYNYDRKINDEVVFRIKEGNSISWYYEHVYKTDQFLPNNLFPFGFPIVPDSKRKTYYFEIESVMGKPEDAVTLSREEPLITTSFQYPKRLIIKDKNVLLEFASNKIKYTKIDRDFIISFFKYVNFVFLLMLLEYLLLERLFKLKPFSFKTFNISYIMVSALTLLVFSAILLYLKKNQLSESLSIWAYFLLVVGVVYTALESKRK